MILLISCNKDDAQLKITDFSKSFSTELEPYSLIPYAMFNLKVKGYANDTIIIKTIGTFNLKTKFVGEIDTLFNSDYYGEGPIRFVFEPYKATKGTLEVDIRL